MILYSERGQTVNEYSRLNPELKVNPSLPLADPNLSSCCALNYVYLECYRLYKLCV